jgi:PhnB protein
MLGIQPYINFNGNCREAIELYKDALGAELLFAQTYGESPMKGMGADDNIMHCTLQIGSSHIMACDSPEGQPTAAGSNISLAVGSDDVNAADQMFNKLAEGGSVTMPMQETFWAERFGMLTDKFGVSWMFNCEKTGTDHSQASA